MKQTPNKILNDILSHLRGTGEDPSEYTYIIMGKTGPTGKTWICDKLKQYGYNACEITESICWIVDYQDTGNHYLIKKQSRVVVIILNAPIEPAKEMTLEEIEKKLGHRVKVISKGKEQPIKSPYLCGKCKYGAGKSGCRGVPCSKCELMKRVPSCGASCSCHTIQSCPCHTIQTGRPCPYFVEEEPTND